MNRWAQMLAALPATAQRLIARTQRISLPRRCDADLRVLRLRRSLCHAATVRATYAWLPFDVQAALQDLRTCRGGISPTMLAERYGLVRSWTQMAADPKPQTISERLILLGWLLPRPAAPHNPARLLLAPELRAWLPQPLCLQSLGAPPLMVEDGDRLPLAVRAATTLLLACAAQPLPVCADGCLSRAALRTLEPMLAPLEPTAVADVCRWLWPLLRQLGLVATHQGQAELVVAGQRFFQQSPAAQHALLRHAWLSAPQPDAALASLLIDEVGIDWPLLRRRLVAWAEALPADQCFDPASLFESLTAACGPLANAHTHGFRTVDRAPWQPKRAATIWNAALHGPLTWLGIVEWTTLDAPSQSGTVVFRRPTGNAAVGAQQAAEPSSSQEQSAVGSWQLAVNNREQAAATIVAAQQAAEPSSSPTPDPALPPASPTTIPMPTSSHPSSIVRRPSAGHCQSLDALIGDSMGPMVISVGETGLAPTGVGGATWMECGSHAAAAQAWLAHSNCAFVVNPVRTIAITPPHTAPPRCATGYPRRLRRPRWR